jgi:hypothetical protein
MVCLTPRESAQNELGVGIWDVNLKVKRGRGRGAGEGRTRDAAQGRELVGFSRGLLLRLSFGGRGILSDVCILVNTHINEHLKRGFIPPV